MMDVSDSVASSRPSLFPFIYEPFGIQLVDSFFPPVCRPIRNSVDDDDDVCYTADLNFS